MNGPIRRVVLVLGMIFLVLVVDLTYWQAIAADRLRQNPRNPRVELTRSGQERGEILSADAVVLARSVPDPLDSGAFRREYLYGSVYAHVVGFSSALFGDRGVEAAHASLLRSRRDLTTSGILNALLGEDLRPRSIQLTLNHELQATAARALSDRRGSVVALDPATGQVLAMANSPTFNPNALVGTNAAVVWDALTESPDGPLVNRAVGGSLPELLTAEGTITLDEMDPRSALGIATRVAAAGQDGLMMRPYVTARVFDADSDQVSQTDPEPMTDTFGHEAALSLYGESRPLVVRGARDRPGEPAGNSGVAELDAGEPAAWFFGVWPAARPTIVVAVVVYPGGPGEIGPGRAAAASIGRAVLAAWIHIITSSDE
ncbi:penicillin-binding transpeptidase domain-containing protein [Candidatus Spongiisocius sp.]|uniref:penicillin-binding transpeptidase domain-containing protein n=1 Tax=Candidatus Spongiisocius sp. TaxID=3101273 RepID=UPI003B5A64A0